MAINLLSEETNVERPYLQTLSRQQAGLRHCTETKTYPNSFPLASRTLVTRWGLEDYFLEKFNDLG